MTDVLHGRNGPSAAPGAARDGKGIVLDDETKQLLRQLVGENRRRLAPGSGPPVDWDAIWSLAENAPSEEVALGLAVLAAEQSLAGDQLAAPSALLARAGRRNGPDDTGPRSRAGAGASELPNGVRRAIAGATWLRNVGIIVVLFAVWQLWGTGIAESQSQSQLRTQYESLVRRVATRDSALPAGPRTAPTEVANAPVRPRVEAPVRAQTMAFTEGALPGGVLGRIRIPAVGVDDYFVEGVGEAQLQEGPGRYPGSGIVGQIGNLAIAGHRTTYGAPFFRLGELHVGDVVIIDVPGGRATYKISQPPFAVSPYDVNVLADFGDARLTLTTCNPPFFATTRLIAVAKLTRWLPTGALVPAAPAGTSAPRNAVPTTPRPVATSAERSQGRTAGILSRSTFTAEPAAFSVAGHPGTGPSAKAQRASTVAKKAVEDGATVEQGMADEGSGWHLSRLPVVLGVLIALCTLGALYDRMAQLFAGISRWLVMVPMWAAGLLALFKVLGLLLPADL